MMAPDVPTRGPEHSAGEEARGGLSPLERMTLLALARDAIAAAFEERMRTILGAISPGLAVWRGAFVSLHEQREHALRGCVGSLTARRPLHEVVGELAVAAAFEDPRFPPVEADELPDLVLEISVLSPPAPIRPGEVVPGLHGLCIIHGTQRGVLLPQVASEYGWDRAAFLANLCRKAGLGPDAWQATDAALLAFYAEVFREEPAPGGSRR
jgi:AmmeMemoRadiSam system protein A